MAEDIKNLCAPIPSALHAQVRENQEASGKTLGQYMTWLITQFYEYEKGGTPNMADNKRTVAFQVPADLFEQFKAATGRSVMACYAALRIDAAKRLLRETDLSVAQIADRLGFDTPNYFSKTFRRLTSVTPSAYRKRTAT